MACSGCGEQVVTGARFCSVCGTGVAQAPLAPPPPPMAQHGLARIVDGMYRPREGRMVAGVCAGVALRYGWDPTLVRVVLVLSALLGVGVPVLAYLVAWVVMPNGQFALPAQTGYGAADSMKM